MIARYPVKKLSRECSNKIEEQMMIKTIRKEYMILDTFSDMECLQDTCGENKENIADGIEDKTNVTVEVWVLDKFKNKEDSDMLVHYVGQVVERVIKTKNDVIFHDKMVSFSPIRRRLLSTLMNINSKL